MLKHRLSYALLAGLTIALGLASRKFAPLLPPWLAKNAGDALYAVMVYWLVKCLAPRLSIAKAALAAGLFCLGIELLKLVQVPALVAACYSRAGALVLGSGFHLSNLVCYAAGTLLAALFDLGELARYRDCCETISSNISKEQK